jgi:uncharacterized protein YceK
MERGLSVKWSSFSGVEMRGIVPIIIPFMVICLLLSGCSSLTVDYFTSNDSLVYPATDTVQVFWENPDKEYKIIGLITAESMEHSKEKLLEEVERKAMEIGAHGIVIQSSELSPNRVEAFAIRFKNK